MANITNEDMKNRIQRTAGGVLEPANNSMIDYLSNDEI